MPGRHEGQISRTGFLGPFYRGIEVILHGRDAIPVIPVAIDNLWGSLFSRSEGTVLLETPREAGVAPSTSSSDPLCLLG